VLVAALVAAGGAGAGVVALAARESDPQPAATPAQAAPAEPAPAEPAALVTPEPLTVGEIYAQAAPGVVEIAVSGGAGFGSTEGEGSGFVLDTDGDIVTNAHVVDGASSMTVTFADGEQADAELVGVDASSDLAVIRVDRPASELTPLELGQSDTVAVGDTVVALGSPFGLEGTITAGIVSALGRSIDAPNGFTIRGAIQTDAAVNHGNSGGPLLDETGAVIGVNAQIASESGGNDGVGFAIPVDTVTAVVRQLVAGGSVERPYLGVSLATVDERAAVELGLPQGAQVAAVQEGTPAAAAGLRAGTAAQTVGGLPFTSDGDVVTALDGEPIAGADELIDALASRSPGDTVTLGVHRDGRQLEIEVTLGTRPT
jgi:S1-C subfamily serine protease